MNIEQFVNQLVHCHVGIYSFDQHWRRGYCILYPDKQNEILILKCVAFLTFGRSAINFFDRLMKDLTKLWFDLTLFTPTQSHVPRKDLSTNTNCGQR